MTGAPAAAGALGGWLVDRLAGEPPAAIHPVAWFGTVMRRLEARTYRDRRAAGLAHVAVGVCLAGTIGIGLDRLLGRAWSTALASYVSIAGRMLAAEATEVLDAVELGDLDRARRRLPTLVGRVTDGLPEREVVRAVTESVAENTVDAVTAPLLWAAVGGAPAVLVHRAVNTLDAMVGHHDRRYERFGWAAARLDDAANWIPARLAAAGVALLRPRRASQVLVAVRTDARHHPSPNGGVIEAAFAAALGVRLGGRNVYAGKEEDRGTLGSGPPPTVAEGRKAVRLAHDLGALTAVCAAGTALAARRWIRPAW
jgi:adenosylcobinamide-phosphate synthase